jgi:hypothetical protein
MKAYDRIIPAFGLFNLQDGGDGKDLFALLAYLRYKDKDKDPSAFNKAFEVFGIQADKDWVDKWGRGSGAALYSKSQRSYTASFAVQTENGSYKSVPLTPEVIANYFGTWHWFYRFIMAARTLQGYRSAMWDMARIRLRELLETPWRKDTIPNFDNRRALVRDVYTSQRAIAIIFFWYLRFPKDIINDEGEVGERLTAAFKRANLTKPLAEWKDLEEQSLIQGLIDEAQQLKPKDFNQALNKLLEWPQWTRASSVAIYQLSPEHVFVNPSNRLLGLQAGRGTFLFDSPKLASPLPSKFAIRLSGIPKSNEFGVLAIAQRDEQADGGIGQDYKITAVVLTLVGEQGEVGLKLPISGGAIAFKLPLSDNPDAQKIPVFNTPNNKGEDFEVYAIGAIGNDTNASLPTNKHRWKLDLSAIQGTETTLNLDAILVWQLEREDNTIVNNIYLQVELKASFFKNPLQWFFAAAGTSATLPDTPNTVHFDKFERVSSKLQFVLSDVQKVLQDALPLPVPKNLESKLQVRFVDGKLGLRIELEVAELGIDLGSPLARLVLTSPKLTLDTFEGLSLSFPKQKGAIALLLDIFAKAKADNKVINNLWAKVNEDTKDDSWVDKPWLIELTSNALSQEVSSINQPIFWTGSYPTIHKQLFQSLKNLKVNPNRKLQAFTGDVLAELLPCQVTFATPSSPSVNLGQNGDRLQLELLLKVQKSWATKETIFSAQGRFGFSVGSVKQGGYVDIQSGAFVADEEIDITVTDDVYDKGVIFFGEKSSDEKPLDEGLLSLHIPQGAVFTFSTDPRNPKITWDVKKSQEKTLSKIAIRIPASKGRGIDRPEAGRFTFEMEKFSLGTAGFDLKGAVRVESVWLGAAKETGFQKPLAIKGVEKTNESNNGNNNQPKEPKIGEIEFRQSKLVAGSLQASAQLTYFDDAVGTFFLFISQDAASKSLAVVGSLDITGLSEFHVDSLFATFQITVLHLETRYINKEWSSSGYVSGSIKFQPAKGRSVGEMGALADLFNGVVVEFEQLNPVQLGSSQITISFPAKQFEFANIFKVELRGIRFNPKSEMGFELLGDITIQRLPGVDAQLTFGGITLTPQQGRAPKFSLSRIGAGFSVGGGFKIAGVLEWIDNAQETGFGGAVTIETDTLPKLSGLVKLTRARTQSGELVPSLAIYFATDLEVSLFAGFFLRSLGIGLGINQALDGLQDKTEPLPKRLTKFVDNPKGLPEPRRIESWVPNPPASASGRVNWMLVATGLITLGNLPANIEHPLAGSILLAIDQDLDIVAGINLWLFCSPEQTKQPQFFTKPVARGAIAISPREEKVFGLFRTIKNPKLTDKAPPILAQVLNQVDTSLMFLADRNGFLLEVGWPWETRITYQYGPLLRGTLTSGFRFGIYRGLISFGLNFAINVILNAKADIEFDTPLGSAGASLSVYGEGYFRCSFIGAITPSFRPYLLGRVQLGATVQVRAEAHCEFSKKICGIKIRLRISFSSSFKISISAALTAAMAVDNDNKLLIGFQGEARVAVSVAGYALAGKVPFRYQETKVTDVDTELKKILPRPVSSTTRLRSSQRIQPVSASFPSAVASVQPMAVATTAAIDATQLTTLIERVTEALSDTHTEEVATQPIWNYRFCRTQNQIRVLLFPKQGVPEPGREYPTIERVVDAIADSDGKIRQALEPGGDRNLIRAQFANTKNDKLSDNFTVAKIRPNYWRITDNVSQKSYGVWLEASQPPRFHIYKAENAARFQISLKSGVDFKGFLGSDLGFQNTQQLAWEESLGQVVLSAKEILQNPDPSEKISPEDAKSIRDLTLGDFLVALTESAQTNNQQVILDPNQKEIVDPRTQNPVLANNDDETAGIAPEGLYSPHFKGDYERGKESYDCKLADACKSEDQSQVSASFTAKSDEAPSEGLSSGLLMTELVSLLKDSQAQAGQVASAYTVASPMNLILVFNDLGVLDENDPVSQLLDTTTFKVDGQPVILESVRGDNAGKKLEYDLIAGPYFQSNSKICLTWNFKREDDEEPSSEDSNAQRPIGNAYQELDHFVVTRTILQKPTKTRVEEVPPMWILTSTGDWLRPQFQFVDEHLSSQEDGVDEGDLLQYKIEALTLDNRRLATCIVNVVRQTVQPLAPPSQSQVLHKLKFATKTYNPGDFELAVAFLNVEPDDIEEIPKQLRMRYRVIPASTVGAYGFEQNPGVQTKWSEGLPNQDKDSVNVRYAESEQSRSIPWEEVQAFELDAKAWQKYSFPIQEQQTSNGEQIVYRLTISESDFWKKVKELPAGMAVELFVGREEELDQKQQKPLMRSQLVRCRHALGLPESTLPEESVDSQPETSVNANYFSIGNAVNAIEPLPLKPTEISYLEPQFIQGWAEYQDASVSAPSSEKVQLQLTWRHDLSCRGGTDNVCPLPYTLFNPVASYRIHRIDQYSPLEYVRDDVEKGVPVRPELTVRVMPELMYRATPSTIVVLGRKVSKTVNNRPIVDFVPDWSVKAIDGNKSWQPSGNSPKPADKSLQLVEYDSGPVWLLSAIVKVLDAIKASLDANLSGSGENQSGHKYVFKFHYPLEDRSSEAVQQDGKTLTDRLAKLPQQSDEETQQGDEKTNSAGWWMLDRKTDPFGWWALESLGLSCECHFEDPDGYPIKVDRIVELLQKNPLDYPVPVSIALFLAEDGETFLNVLRLFYTEEKQEKQPLFVIEPEAIKTQLDQGKIPDALSGKFPQDLKLASEATTVFVENPGQKWWLYDVNNQRRFFILKQEQPLQVQVYSVIKTPWNIWSNDTSLPNLLAQALGIRLKGREDQQNYQPLHENELEKTSKNLLDTWLTNVRKRLDALLPDGQPGRVMVYQYDAVITEPGQRSRPSQLNLPINAEGQIGCSLPVPDQWAHQYAIALEIIRRYDTVWSRLRPTQSESELTEQKIPYQKLKKILVERSEPLVPHNIIATPLFSGIQSLVFVHPAAFAATASAVNAVYGQYSGQTVFLQRRIKDRDKVVDLYQKSEEYSKVFHTQIDWKLYQQWLRNPDKGADSTGDYEKVEPGPAVVPLSDSQEQLPTLALKPLEGTEVGVYGADRFVYPDLPGYYEYRVLVYSSAGRVCSPVSETSFVSPLYDQPTKPKKDRELKDEPRQQPRTVGCRDVIFDLSTNTLELNIRLVHPRFHMRDEVSPLWVDAEELLKINQNESLRFGSLPDLYLTYQLYLRVNPDEKDEKSAVPVLVPLAEITPPLGNNKTPSKDGSQAGFCAKAQVPGAEIDGGVTPEKTLKPLPVLQAPTNTNATSRLKPGELYLNLKLQLTQPQCAGVVSTIRNHLKNHLQDSQISNDSLRELIYLSVAREGVWSDIVQTAVMENQP